VLEEVDTMKGSSMTRELALVTIVVLFATSVWATSNLNLSKSNINRTFPRSKFVTATVGISGSQSALVYQVPADGDFVLTQVCVGPVSGGVRIQVSGASIAHVASGACQSFDPGVVLQADGLVSCTTFADEQTFCMISGLLSPAPRPTLTPRTN
jgi:hypothetical protein